MFYDQFNVAIAVYYFEKFLSHIFRSECIYLDEDDIAYGWCGSTSTIWMTDTVYHQPEITL